MSNGKSNEMKLISKRKSKENIISQTYEFPYMIQPQERSLAQIIYDSEKGKILGRTPKNWGELLIFYTIFYIVLAALFGICMKGLLWSIDDGFPKWQLDDSLIGTNPGLGFRPVSHDVDKGSLIWYDATNQTEVIYWSNRVDEFLKDYKDNPPNQMTCDFKTPPSSGHVCNLDLTDFGPCIPDNSFGFNNSAPCFFLKLNKIYGWSPECYNDTNELPKDMPEELKKDIAALPKEERNQIWVSCRGENGADRENLGLVEYFPRRGFPSYYYPYMNIAGYQSPLVAVKFTRPLTNQIINIECRAWAKNILYVGSFRDRQGSVHFELMIDAP